MEINTEISKYDNTTYLEAVYTHYFVLRHITL